MLRHHLFTALFALVALSSCGSRSDVAAVQEVSIEKQGISLSGVANARQFGGYVIGGRRVRPDVLLRTGNLSKATDGAVDTLENVYHLKYIFDFRSSIEHDSAPDRVVPGAESVWLPCLEKVMQRVAASGMMNSKPSGDVREIASTMLEMVNNPVMSSMADEMYPSIVFDEDAQKHYAAFLDSLSVLPEGRAALWHCSQGKDRCGWGSALLLAALGADRDLIVRDFALSNVSYQPLIDQLLATGRERGYSDAQLNTIYALVGVSVDNFNKTYDEIIARYGSIEDYLEKALDCDEAQRTQLREKFLEN